MKIDPAIIVAALLNEASDEELREVEVWRAMSPENEARYRRLARIWGLAEGLEPRLDLVPPTPSEVTGRAEPSSQATPAEPRHESATTSPATVGSSRPEGSPRRPMGIALGMAAILLIGVGIGTWTEWTGTAPPRPEVLVTGIDDVATVTLRDETVVHLAPRSRLVFSHDRDSREVSLTGRAYFAVTPNPDRPFRVRLPGGEVEVLGTRFDVESRDDGMQVTVVDGNVRMATRGARLDVGSSQVARVSATGVTEVEDLENVYEVIDWLGQFLAFESTPMEEIAVELERRFGIQVVIADAELRRRTVTGWFADQSPGAMVSAICTVIEARCWTENEQIWMELSRRSGNQRIDGIPVGIAPSTREDGVLNVG